MDHALGSRVQRAAVQQDLADRVVLRKHRQNGIAGEGLRGSGDHLHALHHTAGTVPCTHPVPGRREVARHGAAHRAKTDEADVHS